MDSNNKATLQKFIKELTTLHYALTFGAFAILFMIYFFMVDDGQFDFSDTTYYFLYICPLLALAGVFGGNVLYKSKIGKIKSEDPLEDKLAEFRAATVQKLSFLEGPSLICAMALMQTNNLLFLIIGLALIVYMFSQKISEEKVIEELGLK